MRNKHVQNFATASERATSKLRLKRTMTDGGDNSCLRVRFVSCQLMSQYLTIWVDRLDTNATRLLNGSEFLNPNPTCLLNGSIILTCSLDFIKAKKKKKKN